MALMVQSCSIGNLFTYLGLFHNEVGGILFRSWTAHIVAANRVVFNIVTGQSYTFSLTRGQ